MTFSEIFDMVFDSFLFAMLLVAISMLFIKVYKVYKKQTWNHPIRMAILLLYVFMLFNITVFRGGLFQNDTNTINLMPFDELLSASYYQASILGKKQALIILVYNVIGNIVWFMPLGFLLALYFVNMNWKRVLLSAFLFSLSIEVLQYVFYTGVSDIDDVIFNVIGALFGYGLYHWFYEKRRISCQSKNK